MAIQENPYLPPTSRVADTAIEGGFIDGGRAVPAGSGTHWLASGWRTFRAQPGTWILIGIVLIVIAVVLAIIPILGNLALSLLTPVFLAGLMLACRKAASGGTAEVGDVFAGFQKNVGSLLLVGVIGLVLIIVVSIPAALIIVFAGGFGASQSIGGFTFGMLIGALVFLALVIPIQMALWFAPALVVIQGFSAGQALGQSFRACLKNIIPFLVYGLILLVLAIVASLPLALGWLVLAPVAMASIYAAYRDIFFAA